MMQITPVGEKGVVRTRPGCLMKLATQKNPPQSSGTFGDDQAIRECNVLGAAAGDDKDWGMQP
jgi:hypothetical protein